VPARDVVILAAARTPIGKYGGSLRDVHPAELGAVAARAAIARAGLQPSDVNDVWIGHARQAGSGPNPARQVAHRAGIPHASPAQTINKACASGLQAIVSAAQSIALRDLDDARVHAIGCTGARIVVTLLHELERRGARRGLATLCVSGGMGMALAIERIG
jgi:acetyl-CoA acetyltransferase